MIAHHKIYTDINAQRIADAVPDKAAVRQLALAYVAALDDADAAGKQGAAAEKLRALAIAANEAGSKLIQALNRAAEAGKPILSLSRGLAVGLLGHDPAAGAKPATYSREFVAAAVGADAIDDAERAAVDAFLRQSAVGAAVLRERRATAAK